MKEALLYQIAINNIAGIGGVTAKRLISYCGSVEQVFKEKKDALLKIPGIGENLAKAVRKGAAFDRAEQEIRFIEKHKIKSLFYLDKDYPSRLKQCEDGPLLLFVKGKACLNEPKMLAVVGTRNMTDYGRSHCESIITELSAFAPVIVSGLAYGVDACAHKAALKNKLQTIAVLAHGLDRIYPFLHHKLAQSIIDQGALVTDFLTGNKPDRENFPKRNRIIAGLCDGIIVVEAAESGGALITANIANNYNRDVFAIPGRTQDTYSQGCNKLIKIHKAHLLESAIDLQYIMNWEPGKNHKKGLQQSLFITLTEEEKKMTEYLKQHGEPGIDQIVSGTGFNLSKATSILLSLEFKEVVKPLPGKTYRLNILP